MQKIMSELERFRLIELRQTFLRQAKTFRALAKMLSKDPRKKMEFKLCEGMAEVSEGFADLVTEQMGKL